MFKYFFSVLIATFFLNVSYAQSIYSPSLSLSFNSNSFNANNVFIKKIDNFPDKPIQVINLNKDTTLKIFNMDAIHYFMLADKSNDLFKIIGGDGNFSHSSQNYHKLNSSGLSLISSHSSNNIYDKNNISYLESAFSINKNDYILEVEGKYKENQPEINMTINKIINKGKIDKTYQPIKISITPKYFYVFVIQSKYHVEIGQLNITPTGYETFRSGNQYVQFPLSLPL